MSGLIGRKIGMTSIFDAGGKSVPCTVIEAGPCTVTQIKSQDIDGYAAVQIAFDDKTEKHTNKPEKGHFAKASTPAKRKLVEVKTFENSYKLGDLVNVDIFLEGEYVDVIGTSKGKGFQGVVKRHGFAGVGQSTHGQHNRLRAPGSIGASSFPSRVFKGMRMAGRMGNDRVTAQNLLVLKVVTEKNLLLVKGCVPGHNNSYVIIQK